MAYNETITPDKETTMNASTILAAGAVAIAAGVAMNVSEKINTDGSLLSTSTLSRSVGRPSSLSIMRLTTGISQCASPMQCKPSSTPTRPTDPKDGSLT